MCVTYTNNDFQHVEGGWSVGTTKTELSEI